jgi:hypothetical protein
VASQGKAVVYPARKDAWVAFLLVPASLAMVGLGAATVGLAAAGAIPPLSGLIPGFLSVGVGGLLLWMFFATSYEITDWDVVARLGPFRWRIPLDAIEQVVVTDGFRLVVGLGLAWSLAMVHIRHRKANGRMAFPVSISPRNRAGFLRELAKVVPGLKVDYSVATRW